MATQARFNPAPPQIMQPTTFRAFASSTRASWWPSSSPPETAKEGGTSAAAGTEPAAAPAGEPATEAAASDLTPDELKQALQAAKEQLELAQKEAAESKDRLVRTLADMQNLRERTARQIADTKQFAVQVCGREAGLGYEEWYRLAPRPPLDGVRALGLHPEACRILVHT